MKTTARVLTGVSLIVPRTETIQLMKSRIRCNIGFAYGLMEKYAFSESQFPPASFVMLKTGERDNRQEEKVQIVNLMLQILRSGDFAAHTVFYPLILERLQAELHFYFNRLGYGPGSGREYLKGIYEEILQVVKARDAERPDRGTDNSRASLGVKGQAYGFLKGEVQEERQGRKDKGQKAAVKREKGYEGDGKERDFPEAFVTEEDVKGREGYKTVENGWIAAREGGDWQPDKGSDLENGEGQPDKRQDIQDGDWQKGKKPIVSGQPGIGAEEPGAENEILRQSRTAPESRGMSVEKGGRTEQDRIESLTKREQFWEETPGLQEELSDSGDPDKREDGRGRMPGYTSWEEKRIGLERRLLGLWGELHGQAHMPSLEAAGIYDYLETLTEEQQEAMAQVIGYDRTVLLESLKGADNQEWRQMKERIEHCLDFARRQEEPGIFQAQTGEGKDSSIRENALKKGKDGTEKDSQEGKAAGKEKSQGFEQWRYSLSEWIGYLENQDWEVLSFAVRDSRDADLKDAREAFSQGGKRAAMEYLGRIENMESLLPMLRLIYQKEPLKEMAKGWLPEEKRLFRQAKLLETARQLLDSSGLVEKGLMLEQWLSLLDQEGRKDFSGRIKAGKIMEYLMALPEEKTESMAHALGFDRAGLFRQIGREGLAGDNRLEDFLAARIEQAEAAFRPVQTEHTGQGWKRRRLRGIQAEPARGPHALRAEYTKQGRWTRVSGTEYAEGGRGLQAPGREDGGQGRGLQVSERESAGEGRGLQAPEKENAGQVGEWQTPEKENAGQVGGLQAPEKEYAGQGRKLQVTGKGHAEPGREVQMSGREYAEPGRRWPVSEKERTEPDRRRQVPGGKDAQPGRELQISEEEYAEPDRKQQALGKEDTESGRKDAEAGETLQISEIEQWKACLRQWFEYMEMEDWAETVHTIWQSGALVSEQGRAAFERGQKAEAVEFLSQAKWDELLPVVSLVYQDQGLSKLARGWMPKKGISFPAREGAGQGEERGKEQEEEKRQVLSQWRTLLETAREDSPWDWTKTQYAKMLEQVSDPEAESILLPVAELLYPHKDGRQEDSLETGGDRALREGEGEGAKDSRSLAEILRDDVRRKRMGQRILEAAKERWLEIRDATAFHVYRTVLKKQGKRPELEDALAQAARLVMEKNQDYYKDMGFAHMMPDSGNRHGRERFWEAMGHTFDAKGNTKLFPLYRNRGVDSQVEDMLPKTARAMYRQPVLRTEKASNQLEQAAGQWVRLLDIKWQKAGEGRESRKLMSPQPSGDSQKFIDLQPSGESQKLIALQPSQESQRLIDPQPGWEGQNYTNLHPHRREQNLQFRRRLLSGREEDEISYAPAELVTVRQPNIPARERQLTPSPPDIETIVKQVKQEKKEDIQFVNRRLEETRAIRKNEHQIDEVLKRISGQQKELEQMKQIQARLIQSTEPGRMAEIVMRQLKGQLQIEKLRKGR